MFFMSLSVTSCGPIRLSNLENMNSSDRQFQLSTKTNDELCNIFNNVYIKPDTEKQVAEILKEREVKECNALLTKRIIPSSKHEKFINTTTKTDSSALINPNKIAISKPFENKKMVKLVDGSNLMYDASSHELNESPLICPLTDINIKADEFYHNNKIDIQQWNVFLKSFIMSMAEENRDALLRYLLTCWGFSYDNLENVVHFRNVVFCCGEDNRMEIRFTGDWKYNDIPVLNLSFGYVFTILERDHAYRLDKLNGHKIKIYADNFQWEKNITFKNIDRSYNQEAVISLLDDDLLDALDKLSGAKKGIIRFYGDKFYDEHELDNVAKCKLKSLVSAARGFMKKIDPPNTRSKKTNKLK